MHINHHHLRSILAFTRRCLLPSVVAAGAAWPADAVMITVPNYSFENPTANTPGFPVNVDLDNWTDTDPRPGFMGPIPWGFGTGNFPNPEVGQPNRLTNMDGNRAAYILASEQLGFYQTLTSPEGIFTVGQAYTMTVGISPQDGTPAGTVLSLSLYHLVGSVITPIATTPVPAFPDTNTFIDYTVSVPMVQPTDAWAGKQIGMLLSVTTAPVENGGYDLDNVRLEQVPEPSAGVLAGLGLLAAGLHRRRA